MILYQGAQLIHFQRKGSDPFLWSAELSTFQEGKAFRGGIPLCWPWFGKVGTPSHGFARIMKWTLAQYVETEQEITLVFELNDNAQTRALWPYAFHLSLEMRLGKNVELTLHVNAEHESTAALHTYLTCKHVEDVSVDGLGLVYHDALQGGIVCQSEENSLHVNCAVDRIYAKAETQTLLHEPTRTLSLFHSHHSDVVVWNPWSEGEVSLVEMQEGDYTQMLCIETARIFKPLEMSDRLGVRIESSYM